MQERRRLKIFIHSPYRYDPTKPDGVTLFIHELIPHLKKRECTVRTGGPHLGAYQEFNAADFTLGRPVKISHDNTSHYSSVAFNKGRAARILNTVQPDVVVFHEPLAAHGAHTLISAMPSRPDGKPAAATIGHFHAQLEKLSLKTNIALWLGKKAIRRVTFDRKWLIPKGLTKGYFHTVMDTLDGRIAVSKDTAMHMFGIYPAEYKVIPNGIDTTAFTPDGPKISSWNDGKQTILFAGRHDPRKGIPDLLYAYALIRKNRSDIKLKISGHGEMTKQLRQMVETMQIPDVEFLGIVPREKNNTSHETITLERAYRSADIVVCPSIGGEGFGRVLAEALASGTLVVGTNINGYRTVIENQPFARMADPGNPQDLERQIEALLSLPQEEKQRLTLLGRISVCSRFDWDIVADQTVAYYREINFQHTTNPDGTVVDFTWPKKERKRNLFPTNGTVFIGR